ncbi:GPI-anchored surface protein, putative [Bodo saltans]|uniref:GPI-anchored surface protein, putative n=1 Tax=Bodo saltans TaxID=75058 RepID=A0A0S4JVD6_BODSA|nr:GPI-anchored surface protein, putative [Bodo saltans]|eukprot:CUG93361.1 GPI-anchored surface protein, putative [Bodo saltans]
MKSSKGKKNQVVKVGSVLFFGFFVFRCPFSRHAAHQNVSILLHSRCVTCVQPQHRNHEKRLKLSFPVVPVNLIRVWFLVTCSVFVVF